MDFRVLKSEDGRMFVQSRYDDFVASFVHGEWVNEKSFSSVELEDFPSVEDSHEAQVIVKEAKKALSRL